MFDISGWHGDGFVGIVLVYFRFNINIDVRTRLGKGSQCVDYFCIISAFKYQYFW